MGGRARAAMEVIAFGVRCALRAEVEMAGILRFLLPSFGLGVALFLAGPVGAQSNCCTDHGGTGCDNSACQTAVCGFLGPSGPFAGCCTTEWDVLCEAAAGVLCSGLCVGVSPFLCYSVRESKGAATFLPRTLNLDDDLEDKDFEAKKPAALCNPLNLSTPMLTIPALDTDSHLKAYVIKESKGEPKHVKETDMGMLVPGLLIVSTVDTSKPDRLLVPSTKSIISPVADATHNIDHYKCYKAKTSKGTPKFAGGFFSGQDQFEPAKGYELKKVSRVCLPAELFGP
jgi:hypothetical protein